MYHLGYLQTPMRQTSSFAKSSRRGSTIVEVFAAATVLGVVFALLVPSIAGLHSAARSQTIAVLASEELSNVLELALADHRAGVFDLDDVRSHSIDDELVARLDEAKISAELEAIETPPGQRLTVTLQFGRNLERSTSLSCWLWETPQ